jgi:hypothetical protein
VKFSPRILSVVVGRSQTCSDGQIDTTKFTIRSPDRERWRLNRFFSFFYFRFGLREGVNFLGGDGWERVNF